MAPPPQALDERAYPQPRPISQSWPQNVALSVKRALRVLPTVMLLFASAARKVLLVEQVLDVERDARLSVREHVVQGDIGPGERWSTTALSALGYDESW